MAGSLAWLKYPEQFSAEAVAAAKARLATIGAPWATATAGSTTRLAHPVRRAQAWSAMGEGWKWASLRLS
jgi:hypothetical protein